METTHEQAIYNADKWKECFWFDQISEILEHIETHLLFFFPLDYCPAGFDYNKD